MNDLNLYRHKTNDSNVLSSIKRIQENKKSNFLRYAENKLQARKEKFLFTHFGNLDFSFKKKVYDLKLDNNSNIQISSITNNDNTINLVRKLNEINNINKNEGRQINLKLSRNERQLKNQSIVKNENEIKENIEIINSNLPNICHLSNTFENKKKINDEIRAINKINKVEKLQNINKSNTPSKIKNQKMINNKDYIEKRRFQLYFSDLNSDEFNDLKSNEEKKIKKRLMQKVDVKFKSTLRNDQYIVKRMINKEQERQLKELIDNLKLKRKGKYEKYYGNNINNNISSEDTFYQSANKTTVIYSKIMSKKLNSETSNQNIDPNTNTISLGSSRIKNNIQKNEKVSNNLYEITKDAYINVHKNDSSTISNNKDNFVLNLNLITSDNDKVNNETLKTIEDNQHILNAISNVKLNNIKYHTERNYNKNDLLLSITSQRNSTLNISTKETNNNNNYINETKTKSKSNSKWKINLKNNFPADMINNKDVVNNLKIFKSTFFSVYRNKKDVIDTINANIKFETLNKEQRINKNDLSIGNYIKTQNNYFLLKKKEIEKIKGKNWLNNGLGIGLNSTINIKPIKQNKFDILPK